VYIFNGCVPKFYVLFLKIAYRIKKIAYRSNFFYSCIFRYLLIINEIEWHKNRVKIKVHNKLHNILKSSNMYREKRVSAYAFIVISLRKCTAKFVFSKKPICCITIEKHFVDNSLIINVLKNEERKKTYKKCRQKSGKTALKSVKINV